MKKLFLLALTLVSGCKGRPSAVTIPPASTRYDEWVGSVTYIIPEIETRRMRDFSESYGPFIVPDSGAYFTIQEGNKFYGFGFKNGKMVKVDERTDRSCLE